jgi:two-component sensor histidine kinase
VTNDGAGKAQQRGTGMGLRLTAIEALQAGGFIEYGKRDGGEWQVRLVVPLDE